MKSVTKIWSVGVEFLDHSKPLNVVIKIVSLSVLLPQDVSDIFSAKITTQIVILTCLFTFHISSLL